MASPLPRLLALDVDGTLLDDKGQLPDAVRHGLQAVLAADIGLLLCSGRSLTTLPPLARRIAPRLPLIAFNGAATLDVEGRLVRLVVLPLHLARQLILDVRAAGEEPFAFVHPDQPGDILAQKTSPNTRDYLLHNSERVTWVASLPAALSHPPIELTCMLSSEKQADRLEGALRQDLTAETEVVRAYNPANKYWSLSIHGRGANKGDALRDYLQMTRIAPGEVWAVGDGVNDIGMFHLAGRSFAMGNAPEAVRQAADEVLPPHQQAGILALVRRLV